MSALQHTADESGCANPECSCVPYDGGPLSSDRMPWQMQVCDDGWPMVHNVGDVICVPDPNHHAGCAWDVARFRLIAAAPDFFASAKDLIEAWDARTTAAQQIVTGKSDADLQRQAMEAIEGLRAAIDKATGEAGR